MQKTIALVIAERIFRDEEYLIPKKIILEAGHQVMTVSTTLDEALGKLGAKVKPDILIDDLTLDMADALIFIGGGGSSQYFNDPVAHQIAKSYFLNGKVVGAICIAPVILANAGLLKGKKATVFPDGIVDLEKGGAIYTPNPVVVDGKMITGNGPEAAKEFGQTLVSLLI